MFADTLLIIFISVGTALLSEGLYKQFKYTFFVACQCECVCVAVHQESVPYIHSEVGCYRGVVTRPRSWWWIGDTKMVIGDDGHGRSGKGGGDDDDMVHDVSDDWCLDSSDVSQKCKCKSSQINE